MRRGRSVPLALVVWLIVGAVVAGSHHYFDHLSSIGPIISAVLAVLLWPLILVGVRITVTA